MKRKTSKTIRIQKSLKRAGYEVEVKKQDQMKWYKIVTPKQETALEVIKRKEQPAVIVIGKENVCYCQKVSVTIEEGKAVAVCKKEMPFQGIEEIKIRQ